MLDGFFEAQADPDATRAAAISGHRLVRLGEPADIASCMVYLASDEAGWVTGVACYVIGTAASWPGSGAADAGTQTALAVCPRDDSRVRLSMHAFVTVLVRCLAPDLSTAVLAHGWRCATLHGTGRSR